MGFYDDMGNLAASLVETFTIGQVTIKNIASETYNTTTGQVARSFDEVTVPCCVANIMQEKEENRSHDHFVLYVAGKHLDGFVPEVGAVIEMPDGLTHHVPDIQVYPEQSAYKLFVAKDVWQD